MHFVEENSMDKPENIKIIKADLDKMLANEPERIVLGCTHYPFLLDVLSQFAPKDMFIDPALYFAEYIKNDLTENNLITQAANRFEEFYVSSSPELFKSSSKMFYDVENMPELLTF